MDNKYDIDINSYPISPPIGGVYRFGAGANIYGKTADNKWKIVHNIGEVWGETKEEAERKATKLAKEWIAQQK